MKYRWIEKNVDLDRLKEAISSFFEEQRFKIKCQSSSDSYHLVGIRRLPSDQFMRVAVIVSGTPDDFSVELQAGEGVRSTLTFSSMFTFWGAGGLLLQDYKTVEFYQKLEEKFWNYIEGTVSQLINSASLS